MLPVQLQERQAAAENGEGGSAPADVPSQQPLTSVETGIMTQTDSSFTNPSVAADHNAAPVPSSPERAESGSQTEADLPAVASSASATTTAAAASAQPELPPFQPDVMRQKAGMAPPLAVAGGVQPQIVHASDEQHATGMVQPQQEPESDAPAAKQQPEAVASQGDRRIDGVGSTEAVKSGCRCSVM